jgi:glycosyltransferase involved in cell wall biosynthesis
MRVLHIAHDLEWGGVQRYLADTLPELVRQGHRVRLLLVTGEGPLVRPLIQAGVEVEWVPWISRRGGLTIVRRGAAQHLTRVARDFHPQVLHTHLPWGHVAGRFAHAAVGARIPWVATVHGATPDPRHRVLQAWATHHVTVWHRVSSWVPKPAKAPSLVLPPGVPLSTALSSRQPGVVGVASRLVAGKRIDRVIRALARMPAFVTLTVIGTGPEQRRLVQLADTMRVGGRITWLEDVDARPLLPTFSALAAPSRDEGFALAVGEALTAGVPVAASDIAAHRAWAARCPKRVILVRDHLEAWVQALTAALAIPPGRCTLSLNDPAEHAALLVQVYRRYDPR